GLEERTAREQRPDAALLAHRPALSAQGGEVASEVDLVRARRQHALLEAGEEPLEVTPPARQEGVHVTALRHAGAFERARGIGVAVDDRDPVEPVGEDTGCAHPGDAAADHHRTLRRHRGLSRRAGTDESSGSGRAASSGRYACTGCDRPRTRAPPAGAQSRAAPACRRVSSETRTGTPSSLVSSSMRAATLTASPIAVYSRRRGAPTSPTTTVPVCTPIPMRSSGSPRATRIRLSAASASCM